MELQLEEINQKLTDRQRTYLTKLATSRGRDIIPYDMDLYRELMGLGLIEDKGRRLGLSKAGRAVVNLNLQ